MNLQSFFSSAHRVAQRVRQSTTLLALTAVTSAQAALPTVEGPKTSTDSSFYGQISGYVNDGIVLGGLILAAVALLVVANAIIATFAEVQQGKSTWAKFGMLVVVGIVLVVAVNLDCTQRGTIDEQGLVTFSGSNDENTYSLIDEITKRAIATGARILAVRSDDLPSGADLNAILRFPL